MVKGLQTPGGDRGSFRFVCGVVGVEGVNSRLEGGRREGAVNSSS
jgi:hypothetical protein